MTRTLVMGALPTGIQSDTRSRPFRCGIASLAYGRNSTLMDCRQPIRKETFEDPCPSNSTRSRASRADAG